MGDVFGQLIQAAKDLGGVGAVVFAILWWLERSERKATQAKLEDNRDTMLRDTINAMNTTAGGLKETAVGVQEMRSALGSVREIVKIIADRMGASP